KFVREMIRIKLSRSGLEVFEAGNGEEGVALAETLLPDIILMDVMMPKMNGFDACENLKANPVTRAIPILMLTARGEQTNQEKGLSAGAAGFLSKPFSPQKLADLVIEILQRPPDP
ncbi:MAG TPA: response regulator, partial [Nitrospiria bacterium]